MTELTIALDAPAPVASAEPAVFVTEREVLLASAAALGGPAVRIARRRTLWQALFVAPIRPRAPRRTRRPDFIEEAMMARMMQRL
ncbi:hypothetical protein [Mycolicibacterium psychrotolerans]|uniref:Uncharacterized protein n=1 Tax=Mycolicibacterium psychrotolerans TaxID=216929 RepID=A0A7I7MEN2_9MYCO|nr:hypothetical protein [Mycolicibacterium psychrotolerans]BBX69819.1 hypothetical protein MPSYJ_32800 [Mycolicibacterium psychrotolerans]